MKNICGRFNIHRVQIKKALIYLNPDLRKRIGQRQFEAIFEAIIAENFPKSNKRNQSQIQDVQ